MFALPVATVAQSTTVNNVAPRCIKPGGTATLNATNSKNAVTKVKLLAMPQAEDVKTGQSYEDITDKDLIDLGTFPLTTEPSSPGFENSRLTATWKTPTETKLRGYPIYYWILVTEGYDDAGTSYGRSVGYSGDWAADTQAAVFGPHKTSKGNSLSFKAYGFGTAKVYAHFKKGKKTTTFTLPTSSTDSVNSFGLPCGATNQRITTTKLKKGTYKVTVNTSKTKATGGVAAGKVKLT